MTELLLVGKYPPVQGGTSSQFLWLSSRLAGRGVDVTVLDPSASYLDHERCDIAAAEWAALSDRYPEMARVRRVVLEPDDDAVRTIPRFDALETRLVAAGLQEAERARPLAVVSNYLDPYATAAARIADVLAVPVAYRHAGSDLFYQAGAVTRHHAYRAVLDRVDLVLSTTMHAPLARRYGARPEAIRTHVPILTPASAFALAGPADDLRTDGGDPVAETGALVVGMAGKLGDGKGVFELVRALGALRAGGVPVHLAVLSGSHGPEVARFSDAVDRAGLRGHVAVLPFRAPWRVAELFRTCHLLCSLEHDFHVAGHGSSYLREMLSVGRPVLVSGDMRTRLGAGAGALDGIRVVRDPADVGELTAVLRSIVADRAGLADAATRGNPTVLPWTSDDAARRWADEFVDDLGRAAELRAADRARRPALLLRRRLDFLRRVFEPVFADHPALRTAAGTVSWAPEPDGSVVDDIRRFADAVREAADAGLPAPEAPVAATRVELHCARLQLLYGPVPGGQPPPPGFLARATGLRLLSLPVRLLDARPAPGRAWHVAQWPVDGPLGVRVRAVELSRAGHLLLADLDCPRPRRDAEQRVVERTAVALPRAKEVIESLLAAGALVAGPAGTVGPGQ